MLSILFMVQDMYNSTSSEQFKNTNKIAYDEN